MFKHFPHLSAVLLSYVAAFLLFYFLGPQFFENILTPFGLVGVFIAGSLYTYSFTASTGAILLVVISTHYDAGLIAVVAGLGGVTADMTIFRLINSNLKKEVDRIAHAPLIKIIGAAPLFREHWFRDLLGALLLASPLPDEIGVAIMASAKIKEDTFGILAFIADMLGVYLLVSAAILLR